MVSTSSFPHKIILSFVTARKCSCGKVMFLHLSVSHSVRGGWCAPPRQTPPPPGRHSQAEPRRQTPPRHTYPLDRHPLRDGHWSGRYASYWNAFLLKRYLYFKCRLWKVKHLLHQVGYILLAALQIFVSSMGSKGFNHRGQTLFTEAEVGYGFN